MSSHDSQCDRFCRSRTDTPWWSIEIAPLKPFTPPHHCTRLESSRHPEDTHFAVRQPSFQDPSNHHVLAVQTAPRPQDSLEQTIASLTTSGSERWLGAKLLIADGCRPNVPPGWLHSFSLPPTSGSAKTFVKLLRHSLSIDPGLESLTIIQDDVFLCLNALDYISRMAMPPDITLLTWFTYPYDYAYPPSPAQQPHPSELALPVLACRPTRFFILGQAFTLPRRTVDSLLTCPHVAHDWPKTHGSDEMPAWALGDAPYATHFPNLAQHIAGENSACLLTLGNPDRETPHSGKRTSPYFPGMEFDALSLIS
jgi:hypothetical protein